LRVASVETGTVSSIYPLVMTNSSPWKMMALIEIDGLAFLKMVDLSVAMLNNQMVNSKNM
jgi:hypothetical protein